MVYHCWIFYLRSILHQLLSEVIMHLRQCLALMQNATYTTVLSLPVVFLIIFKLNGSSVISRVYNEFAGL